MNNIVILNKIKENKNNVVSRIDKIRTILKSNGTLIISKRKDEAKDFRNTFSKVSFTIDDVRDVIINLTIADYVYSIYDTQNNRGYSLVIIKEINTLIIYIKILEVDGRKIICYSFHESLNKEEYNNRPYKRGKRI